MSVPTPSDGFNAEEAVHVLRWKNPEKFGGDGQWHEIPEPSTEAISKYLSGYSETIMRATRDAQGVVAALGKDDEDEDLSPTEREERDRARFVEQQKASVEIIERRREILAELCSGTPSLEELTAAPHRIYVAFEAYILGAINPEA